MRDLELQPPLSDDLEVTVKNTEVSLSDAQAVTERVVAGRFWLSGSGLQKSGPVTGPAVEYSDTLGPGIPVHTRTCE